MTLSGDRCSVCGEKWDWVSDAPFGFGIYRPVHPGNRCVPKPPVAYEPDDVKDDDPPRKANGRIRRGYVAEKRRALCICGGWFTTYSATRRSCSDPCSEARKKINQRAACRRSHQRRKERAA